MKRLLAVFAAPLLVAVLSGPAVAQAPAPDLQVSPEERGRLIDESLKKLNGDLRLPRDGTERWPTLRARPQGQGGGPTASRADRTSRAN